MFNSQQNVLRYLQSLYVYSHCLESITDGDIIFRSHVSCINLYNGCPKPYFIIRELKYYIISRDKHFCDALFGESFRYKHGVVVLTRVLTTC